jgi:hypothetical protein
METNKELFAGTKFSFKVPDAFRHENQIRNFMLIMNDKMDQLSIIYANNDCSCKDGWPKWTNIPQSNGSLSIKFDELIKYLKAYYKESFDETTFKLEWININ